MGLSLSFQVWVFRGKGGKVCVGGCQAAATCGHLRPLEWLQEAASGCRWQENAGGHLRPLAATCGHLRPREWLQVAASGCKWLPVTRECWRPLAATCGHSSGCKWLPFPKSNYVPPACSMQNLLLTKKKPAIHCNSKKQLKQLAPRFASRVSQSQPLPLAFLPIPSHPKHCRATKWKAHYGGSCW